MKQQTNFEKYLAEQMRDPAFAARFEQAGAEWEVAVQIAAMRNRAGLSQRELARRLGTSQQQISRLESSTYGGHTLGTLRRVARVLNATVRVLIEPLSGRMNVAYKKASPNVVGKKTPRSPQSSEICG